MRTSWRLRHAARSPTRRRKLRLRKLAQRMRMPVIYEKIVRHRRGIPVRDRRTGDLVMDLRAVNHRRRSIRTLMAQRGLKGGRQKVRLRKELRHGRP